MDLRSNSYTEKSSLGASSYTAGSNKLDPKGRSEVLAYHLRKHRISPEAIRTITEALLLRLPPPPADWPSYELADGGRRSVPGMRLRRGRQEGVSFILSASIKQPDGGFRSAQFTLGRWRPDGSGISLVQARDAATRLKGELRSGRDPRASRLASVAVGEEDKPVTLEVAYELYKAARTGKKRKPLAPSTQAEYRRVVEVSLRKFKDRPLSDFSGDPRQLVKHFNEVGERTPAEANTQMRVLRAIWNRAHKVMPAKVPAPPAIWDMNQVEARNAGFVTREVKSLWRAIDRLESPQARKGAFVLLLLGLREGALLGMQWSDVDAGDKTIVVRTKGAKTLLLPLSDVVLSVLLARTPENDFAGDNPFVFPSLRGPRPRSIQGSLALASEWRHLDKLAFGKIPPPAAYVAQKGAKANTHPHVFRHTYRTLATSSGASEIAIRLLMGHSLQGDVSFDYLTADLDWLRRAQDGISAYILKAAGRDPTYKFDVGAFR